MAWVRIHDGAMSHPRVVGIVDWKSPFCVWVWGLSYCQLHLTDGAIPREAMPNSRALRTSDVLLERGLWTRQGDGFSVRDYLQHNDSKEVVLAKREAGKARVTKHRYASVTDPVKRVTQGTQQNAHIASGVVLSTNVSSIQNTEGVQGKPSSDDLRGLPDRRRAPRRGDEFGRIYLHRWQLEHLIAVLGPHAEAFELDAWLDALNHRIAHQALPPDPWKFVKGELQAEIGRRGLAVAAETQPPTQNKRISGLMTGGEAFLNRNRRSS